LDHRLLLPYGLVSVSRQFNATIGRRRSDHYRFLLNDKVVIFDRIRED